jgi:competence protein ComGC
MENARTYVLNGLINTENSIGNPTFIWQGNSYNFIPSISEFNRQLESGGFQIVKLLTATVRKYNISDDNDEDDITPIFPNGTPTAQQTINYSLDSTNYRIESVKHDPTNSYMRIIAHSTTRGT